MPTPYDITDLPDATDPGDTDKVLLIRDGAASPLDLTIAALVQKVALSLGDGDAVIGEYTHNQVDPSDMWVIDHNLNRHPAVRVVDTTNRIIVTDVLYNTLNRVTVSGAVAFAGKAYLN